MSKSINIVTYLSKNQILTDELINVGNLLVRLYPNLKMILYCEKKNSYVNSNINFPLEQILMRGTKYCKILHALKDTDVDYILSLDNDIEIDIANLPLLVETSIDSNYDIAWGRIYSRKMTNIISKLVMVDKILSHKIIRPLLWKMGVGITIPGQCFLLKVSSFKNKLPQTDTFLDDLSIGIYSIKNNLRYYYSKLVVAYELPSYRFSDLVKQRKRWALGFRQSLFCKTLVKKDICLLLIHAFSYHIIGIIYLVLLLLLLFYNPFYGIFLICLFPILISFNNWKYLTYSFLYQFIFPILHIIWLIAFFRGTHDFIKT